MTAAMAALDFVPLGVGVGAAVAVTLTDCTVIDSVDTVAYTAAVLDNHDVDAAAVFTSVASCATDLPLPVTIPKLTTKDPTASDVMSTKVEEIDKSVARSFLRDTFSEADFVASLITLPHDDPDSVKVAVTSYVFAAIAVWGATVVGVGVGSTHTVRAETP